MGLELEFDADSSLRLKLNLDPWRRGGADAEQEDELDPTPSGGFRSTRRARHGTLCGTNLCGQCAEEQTVRSRNRRNPEGKRGTQGGVVTMLFYAGPFLRFASTTSSLTSLFTRSLHTILPCSQVAADNARG